MTQPLHLTPEEAVKAVMWILMCSNDLLFVFICVALALESWCPLPAASPVKVNTIMRMVMMCKVTAAV